MVDRRERVIRFIERQYEYQGVTGFAARPCIGEYYARLWLELSDLSDDGLEKVARWLADEYWRRVRNARLNREAYRRVA